MTLKITRNQSYQLYNKSRYASFIIRPHLLPGKMWRRMLVYYRRWFCDNNYIFKHTGPFHVEERSDCTFQTFNSFKEIPDQVKLGMCVDSDTSRFKSDELELRENACLWLALVNGQVASIVFTRKGKYFRRWFVDLQPEDTVVFRLLTRPEYRGRGIATSLIRHAMHETTSNSGNAFIDCRTYNKPSKRCIEKAGFQCIGIMKTIKREWALYD